MTPSKNPVDRDVSLDFLRGSAIFFMVFTHVNAVFYSGNSPWLDFFTWWGATICFTVFLFVSGAVYGIKFRAGKPETNKLLKRAGLFLLIYYLLVLILMILRNGFVYGVDNLTDVIVLRKIPEFVEYILPFSLYALFMVVSWRGIKKTIELPALVIILAVAVHLLSNFLYGLDWGEGYVNVVKGILVGHDDWHRFGVLSYFPIFVLGLAWGGRFSLEANRTRFNASVGLAVCAGLILLLKISGISVWVRWPPSVLFLLYGIAYLFAVIYLFEIISRYKRFVGVVSHLGIHAAKFYIYHLLVIFLIGRLVGWREFSEPLVVLLLVFVLTVSNSLAHIGHRVRIS